MKIARESYALCLICLADLVSTIFLVSYREATEGNPLMAYYLHHGIGAFVGVKLVLCLLPLFLMEYARRHRPLAARVGLRVALFGYLFSYAAGVAQLNSDDRSHPAPVSAAVSNQQTRQARQYYLAQMALHLRVAKASNSQTPNR